MKNILLILILSVISGVNAQTGMHFDDTDDLIQTTYPGVLGNNAITVEAWVLPNALSGESVITSWGSDAVNGGRFTFRITQVSTIDVIRIEIKGGGFNGTIDVSDGNWHHVAVTYDPAAMSNKYKLYVDGMLDVAGDIIQPLNVLADVNMRIGRRINAVYTGWYGGSMDEVRVWNVARSQAELQADMNNEYCVLPADLTAYYRMNEGVAGGNNTAITSLVDEVTGNNGAPIGFALTGATSNWVTGAPIVPAGYNVTNVYTECAGFSVTVGGNTYSTTGVYTDVLTTANGCDSTVITDLTIASSVVNNQTLTVCPGGSVTVDGNTYNTTGTYTDVIIGGAAGGCDSTIYTNLTVLAPNVNNITMTVCYGDSYTVNGVVYNATGIYTEVIANGSSVGCDSTVVLDLTVLPLVTGNVSYTECYGDGAWVNGYVYSTSGQYIQTLAGQALNGCDSILTVNVTILPQVIDTLIINECEGYSISINGNTYNASGVYTEFFPNASVNGCDSTVILDLTINSVVVTTSNNGLDLTANNTNATYQWIDCSNGVAINGETNQTFTASANGDYAVVVSEGNCTDTSDCITVAIIGLEENTFNYSIYPNPVISTLNVEMNGNGLVFIYDMFGQLILESEFNDSTKLNCQDLPQGTYIVEVFNSVSTSRSFIVKQ